MNSFPTEINAWKNDVARRLVGLRGHVNDIMMLLPMIPDPEIGMPFTGPLSPVPFVFPPVQEENTGGTQYTAANHCNQCPNLLRHYEITVAGITNRSCTQCAGVNGTFILTAQDGLGSGTRGVAPCVWLSPAIPWCPDFLFPDTKIWWFMRVGNGAASGTTRTIVQLIVGSNYPDLVTFTPSLLPQYQLESCPPGAGSGSGTVTMNRQSGGPFLNDCQNYPATITLRGIS